MTAQSQLLLNSKTQRIPIRQVESREWWLWGFAVVVTLVLTCGILSLTFPGFHLPKDDAYSETLRDWVRGLAALILLFDIYTVYQHLQLQRIRRQCRIHRRQQRLVNDFGAPSTTTTRRSMRQGYRILDGE